MEIFTVKDLSFTYPDAAYPTLSHLSFSVRKGEFLTVCGATGSGKSTLLRLFKPLLSPKGTLSGEIAYNGAPLSTISDRTLAEEIGFVMQNPEQQIVTDKVWHELAFSLESLGYPQKEIARRVMESACFFSLDAIFEKKTDDLSGGLKQLLSLAAVCATEPKALILDEPTAMLDPVSAKNFLTAVKRLNTELGVTVIIAEHRLEDILPLCDRVMILEDGAIKSLDAPDRAFCVIKEDEPLFSFLPSAARLWYKTGKRGTMPLSVSQGRAYLEEHFCAGVKRLAAVEASFSRRSPALTLKNVSFRYEKRASDAVKDLSLSVYENEIFCILGANASGKSTLLKLCCDIHRPYQGHIDVFEKPIKSYKNHTLYRSCVSYLPQDVTAVFLKNTVKEELCDAHLSFETLPFDLSSLSDSHPYDLSGGEQQLLALCKALSSSPRLLLLDEPVKGLDPCAKKRLRDVLSALRDSGMTIVIVTHDTEFCAEIADRCALLFQGECIAVSTPRSLFSQGQFYTTAVSRMTRSVFDGAVTLDDAVTLCSQNGGRA